MPKTIQTYTVKAPFQLNDVDFKPGDAFALPAGWLVDDEYTEIVNRLTFKEPYKETYFENGEKKTDTFYRRVLLPLEPAHA